MATGRPYVSDAFQGRGFGPQAIVAVSAPVLDAAGRPAGIVEGSFDLARLGRFGAGFRPDGGAAFLVLDAADRVVAASAAARGAPGVAPLTAMGGDPLVAALARAERAGRGAAGVTVAEAGGEGAAYGASCRTRLGWRVVVRLPLAAIRRDQRELYAVGLAVAALVAGAALLLARLLARRIAQPLAALAAAMGPVARPGGAPAGGADGDPADGDPADGVHADGLVLDAARLARVEAAPSAPREVAALARHLAAMAGRVAAADAAVRRVLARREAEVADRTRDLAAACEALGEREARLRAIYESTAVGICVIDPAGAVAQTNAAFDALFGAEPGALVGRRAAELTPAEDAAAARAAAADLRAGRAASAALELRFARADGAARRMALTLTRLTLGDGRDGVLGMAVDVTARHEAAAALAEREARLDLIYHSAADLMFLMRVERDAAGAPAGYRCESVNAAYLAATGLAEPQLVGRSVGEILPPGAAAHTLARYARAVATGEVQRYDEAVDVPAGRLVVETTLTPVRDAEGRCTHLLGAARDVTRRRALEAELRESESRFRGVLETVRSAAVTLDAAGRVTFANDALLALTGWTREEALGSDWFERFAAEGPALRPAFARLLAGAPGPAHYENAVLTRAGERRLVAWDNTLLRDAAGAVVGTASIGRDVTEQRALERRLASLSEHDELTGLLNRRGFRRTATQELKSAARTQRRDAVLYVDLDRFKPINDAHGHAAGDDALRGVADVIRATVRDADFGARLGGDEFAIYAVGVGAGQGHTIAARLRANLDAHNAAAEARGRPFRVELSVGVAELEAGDDLDGLLARADAALYARKLARRG
jgi:diguanylate cyclase (GGDEF)-like protein/PAS domain S-box-containing protein